MPIKQNDFIELTYTGKIKENGMIFDTTDAEVAQAHGLPKAKYGEVVVVVGQGQLLKGLEEKLVGKEPGKHTIELDAEHAFGKKNAKLIQMVPINKFRENNIQPVPGLQLNIDNMLCTVRQVTGGRVMVDFNHPLAGKDVIYDVKVSKIVTDKKGQLKSVFVMLLNMQPESITVDGSKAKVKISQELPAPIVPELQKKLKELTALDVELEMPKTDGKKPAVDEHAGHDHPPGQHPKPEKKAAKPKTAAQ
jgi:FKBP-type peptidyl-prolyl cis-trans isomerase SlyD